MLKRMIALFVSRRRSPRRLRPSRPSPSPRRRHRRPSRSPAPSSSPTWISSSSGWTPTAMASSQRRKSRISRPRRSSPPRRRASGRCLPRSTPITTVPSAPPSSMRLPSNEQAPNATPMIQRFDTNRDSKISQVEYRAGNAREFRPARRRQGRRRDGAEMKVGRGSSRNELHCGHRWISGTPVNLQALADPAASARQSKLVIDLATAELRAGNGNEAQRAPSRPSPEVAARRRTRSPSSPRSRKRISVRRKPRSFFDGRRTPIRLPRDSPDPPAFAGARRCSAVLAELARVAARAAHAFDVSVEEIIALDALGELDRQIGVLEEAEAGRAGGSGRLDYARRGT